MLQLFSVLLFLILIREVLAFPKSWCRAQASNSVWNSLEKFMDYGKSSQDKSSSMKNKSCTEKELWRYLNKDLWQSKAGVIFGESIGLKPDFWLHDLKQQNLQLDRVSRGAFLKFGLTLCYVIWYSWWKCLSCGQKSHYSLQTMAFWDMPDASRTSSKSWAVLLLQAIFCIPAGRSLAALNCYCFLESSEGQGKKNCCRRGGLQPPQSSFKWLGGKISWYLENDMSDTKPHNGLHASIFLKKKNCMTFIMT